MSTGSFWWENHYCYVVVKKDGHFSFVYYERQRLGSGLWLPSEVQQ